MKTTSAFKYHFIGFSTTSRPARWEQDFYVYTRLFKVDSQLERQIYVAMGLLNDPNQVYAHLNDLDYLTDQRIQRRLTLWLKFLNDNHSRTLSCHSQLVFSCLQASKQCELFRTQTKHEFETSLTLLDQLFCEERFLTINSIESARYLLMTSLILGKYPGMVVGAIRRSLKMLSKNGALANFKSLFSELFVKYEIPFFLVDYLPNLSLSEIEALMHILQGNNIRTFHKLPLPISRKESWALQNLFPRNMRLDERILLRGIICSKLLIGSKSGSDILSEFVDNCKPFQFNLHTFIDDFPFWKQVVNMCCQIDWDEVVMSMGDFLDHIEYRKYVHQGEFILKGRTPQSLENEVFEWNERQKYEELIKLRHTRWRGYGLEEWVFENNGEVYKFSEIKTGDELFAESQNLKHCAYSYIKYCANGFTSVWSLKRKEDSIFNPYLTVEIRGSEVCQAKGIRNRNLTVEERKLLNIALGKFQFNLLVGFD